MWKMIVAFLNQSTSCEYFMQLAATSLNYQNIISSQTNPNSYISKILNRVNIISELNLEFP